MIPGYESSRVGRLLCATSSADSYPASGIIRAGAARLRCVSPLRIEVYPHLGGVTTTNVGDPGDDATATQAALPGYAYSGAKRVAALVGTPGIAVRTAAVPRHTHCTATTAPALTRYHATQTAR
jgi:hypothetical protein